MPATARQIHSLRLRVLALREMESIHVRALEELRRIEERAEEERRPDQPYAQERISEAVGSASLTYPVPVRATLVRLGLALPATLVGGGVQVYGVSDFGRRLLEEIRTTTVDLREDEEHRN